SPQSVVVSALQKVCSLCEQRGKDGPGDARQRIEDRRVTLLVFLPRRGLPVLAADWLGEYFAEPVELPPGVGELAVDEPYSLDQTTDAGRRGLDRPWRDRQRGLAQLPQDMGRIETPDAVVLEYPGDRLLSHTGSLLGRRHGLEQIEEPVRTNIVGEFQHLRIIAPELMFQTIGETDALNLELFVDARPFPELDDDGIGDRQLAEGPHIGSEAVPQHIGVAAVVFGPGDREAVAEAVELLGVDGIYNETALEQGLDDRPVRRLDGDMDLTRFAAARLQQPGNHIGEAGPVMRELALADPLTRVETTCS